jgi:hypothetical protein
MTYAKAPARIVRTLPATIRAASAFERVTVTPAARNVATWRA